MLFVLRTQAAIVRAAAARLNREPRRHAAGQAVFHAIEPALIGADKVVADPMPSAVLTKVDPPLARQDLRGNDGQTLRAQALGAAEKAMFSQLQGTHCRVLQRLGVGTALILLDVKPPAIT